jgi:uncharacterized protein (DUF433 family)
MIPGIASTLIYKEVLLKGVKENSNILAGKPIIRRRRLAVEHILAMLAAEDTTETILQDIHGWRRTTFRLA